MYVWCMCVRTCVCVRVADSTGQVVCACIRATLYARPRVCVGERTYPPLLWGLTPRLMRLVFLRFVCQVALYVWGRMLEGGVCVLV